VHAPFLLAWGAPGLPGPSLASEGMIAGGVFIIATALLAGVGVAAGRWHVLRKRPTLTFAIAVGAAALSAVLAVMTWGRSPGAPLWIGATAWAVAALGLGLAVSATFFRGLAIGTRVAGVLLCAVLLVPSATGYSLSLLTRLPRAIGGPEVAAHTFKPGEATNLPVDGEGRTETVLLLYQDADDYWIRHLAPDRSAYVVSRFSRDKLGTPGPPATAEPPRPVPRAKRWEFKIREIEVRP
jgi:hypothetical protein